MDDPMHATLARWSDFYLITGTAAATLTGLQFIVQTLLASDTHRAAAGGDPEGGIAAFGSPTVVHFSLALLISALLRVPWPGYGALRATLGMLSVGAIVYAAVLAAAVFLDEKTEGALFALATATLLLLCVGIHNAWDTVTYLTVTGLRAVTREEGSEPPRQSESGTRGRRRR